MVWCGVVWSEVRSVYRLCIVRGDKVGVLVLATRSPHRFNPIGMTLAKLDKILINMVQGATGSRWFRKKAPDRVQEIRRPRHEATASGGEVVPRDGRLFGHLCVRAQPCQNYFQATYSGDLRFPTTRCLMAVLVRYGGTQTTMIHALLRARSGYVLRYLFACASVGRGMIGSACVRQRASRCRRSIDRHVPAGCRMMGHPDADVCVCVCVCCPRTLLFAERF